MKFFCKGLTSYCLLLQSFAMFGGVYAFASCIAQRLRQKQDGEISLQDHI